MMNSSQKINRIVWYIFIIIGLFYCYEFFLRIIPGLLVGQLLTQYHTTAIGIGAFASSYYLGYVVMQIPAGILYDRYPFKWVLVLAVLTCVVGSIIFTLNHYFYVGILGRFILGCGSAFAFVGAISFAKKHLPIAYFTLLVALVISFGTIAGAFGQVVTTDIIHQVDWHMSILGMTAIGILLVGAIIWVPQGYFAETDETQCNSFATIFRQLKVIIKNPIVWLNGIIGSLFYLPTSILAATWGIELLTKQYHFSSKQGSYAIMFLFIGWALGGPVFGWLADKIGREKLILSLASGLAALIISYILFSKHLPLKTLYLSLGLFGALSSAQVLVWHNFSLIIKDKRLAGTASAFTNLLIMFSVMIWDLVIGRLIDALHNDLSSQASHFTAIDLRIALISLPILISLVIILAQFLPKFKRF